MRVCVRTAVAATALLGLLMVATQPRPGAVRVELVGTGCASSGYTTVFPGPCQVVALPWWW